MDKQADFIKTISDFILLHLPGFAWAIAVLIVGFWVIKRISAIIGSNLEKTTFGREIVSFLVSLADVAMKALLLFSVAGMVGINTASFVAVLAAAGFAVGLALQGSLGNFAAGIIILVFKPYKIGDWVEIKEKFGKISDIQIFNTIVTTPGMKTLIIPNGEVINGIVTNFSKHGMTRLELKVHMPYNENFERVKNIIIEELLQMEGVFQDPKPEISIDSFDGHALSLSIMPFTSPENFADVKTEAYARIKSAFHRNNVRIAYVDSINFGEIGE